MTAPAPRHPLMLDEQARYWGRIAAHTMPFAPSSAAGRALIDQYPEWTVIRPSLRARILGALTLDAFAVFERWMSERPHQAHTLSCAHRCDCTARWRPMGGEMDRWCAEFGDILLGAGGEHTEQQRRRVLDRCRHMVKRRPAVDQGAALVAVARPLTLLIG